jgi:SAM-dependent methyltransferase
MTDYEIIRYLKSSDTVNSSVWIEEARFGFRHIKKQIETLSVPSKILEIGCGTGILLAMLSEEFPYHDFQGVEPLGNGFSHFYEINALSRNLGANIVESDYEQLKIKEVDLIFCVNVFEHVADWRNLIRWASIKLRRDGLFMALCPNYGFPYESHFKIPIIWNKKVTHRIFKNYIERFEEENNALGLWSSLNFVKKSEVQQFVLDEGHALGVVLHDEPTVIDDVVARISTDDKFRKRQRLASGVAIILTHLRIFSIIKRFPSCIPYMYLQFRKNI